MTEYAYIRVPYFIPKYWSLKNQYDERLTRPFKVYAPQETASVKQGN